VSKNLCCEPLTRSRRLPRERKRTWLISR
jgi:hypothetical protein